MMFPAITKEQQQQIENLQETTKFIKAEVHTEGDTVSIKLLTDNEQAKAAIPQLQKAMVTSIATTLYQFFGVEGKIV